MLYLLFSACYIYYFVLTHQSQFRSWRF